MDPHLLCDQALEYGTLIGYGLGELHEPAVVVGDGHCEPHQPPTGAKATLNVARKPPAVDVTATYNAYCPTKDELLPSVQAVVPVMTKVVHLHILSVLP